jgi:hypothetical protein
MTGLCHCTPGHFGIDCRYGCHGHKTLEGFTGTLDCNNGNGLTPWGIPGYAPNIGLNDFNTLHNTSEPCRWTLKPRYPVDSITVSFTFLDTTGVAKADPFYVSWLPANNDTADQELIYQPLEFFRWPNNPYFNPTFTLNTSEIYFEWNSNWVFEGAGWQLQWQSSGCQAGSYIDGGNCVPCPAGYFTDTKDQFACTPCPAGFFNNITGSTSCERCQQTTFKDNLGAGFCSPCPANSIASFMAATNISDCLCEEGIPIRLFVQFRNFFT